MGNDGGSIPTRRELVREAARAPTTSEVKVAIREHLEHHWSNCPLSNRKLHTPIVSDCIGNLYNRESILRFLLPGDEVEGIGSKAECEKLLGGRVKSLRDVVDVKFEVQDGDSADAKNNDKIGTNATNGDVQERFVCPITFKELGPNVKCVYLVPCGHAFSEEAIREMKSDRCLQCETQYDEQSVISILPTSDAEKERLMTRSKNLADQSLTHSLKKAPGSKKRKKTGSSEKNHKDEKRVKKATDAAQTHPEEPN